MKFLKTLQKKQNERLSEIDAVDNVVAQRALEKNGDNTPPELFVERDLKIGMPKTAFNNQPDSSADTAHSNFEPTNNGSGDLDNSRSNEIEEEPLPRITINSALVNPHLVSITQPISPYCEEYRSLRTEVLHKSQNQKMQSIVIASVGPSEGKSITAINLAWLLAQTSDITTLLIDGDLRMPSLTDYLGIEVKTGLSEILEGTSSLTNSIVRLEPVGLYLLPGGRVLNDVSELISGTKFKEILREAYKMFDYVIIDAPPLGIFTDGTVLINQADGALLVVRANYTNYKDIERVLETLPRLKMLGAVLNQSEDSLIRESYYNYGYYRKN